MCLGSLGWVNRAVAKSASFMQFFLLSHSGRKKAGPKELAYWKADLVLPKFGFHYVRAAHFHEQPSLCYIIATRYDFCQKYDCKQAVLTKTLEKIIIFY